MRRVAIISGSYLLNIWNGLGRHTTSLAWGLSKNYDVTVFVPSENTSTYRTQSGQISLVHIGMNQPKKVASLSLDQVEEWNNKVFAEIMRHPPFDYGLLTTCDGYTALDAYKQVSPLKIIGFVPYLYKSASWVTIPELKEYICSIEKAMLTNADTLICHTDLLASTVAQESQRDVFVVPNTEMITERIPLSKQKKNQICYVGRMNKTKSIETLIRAVEQLPKVTLILTTPENSDRYANRLRVMAESLGIEDRVKVLGWINTSGVKTLYRESELAVVTGIYEPYGHSVIDPMSIGTRVIVSEFSGLTDYLCNKENRYTNLPSLVALLKKKLSASTDEAIAERRLGQLHAKKNFDTHVAAAILEQLL